MIKFVAKLLGLNFAPHVFLIGLGALLAYILATTLQVSGLKGKVDDLEGSLVAAKGRAEVCEGQIRALAAESSRKKDQVTKALQDAQAAIQKAERRIEVISAPLTAQGTCARLLELDARINGGR